MSVLLVGDGRVATSLSGWLIDRGLPLLQWSRRKEKAGLCASLGEELKQAEVVLIAIRDDAIKPWAEEQGEALHSKTLIHFSGAMVIEGIYGLHPLYAFSEEPLTREEMDRIPFISDEGGVSFGEIFPDFPNPHFSVPPSQRALYHALAVLSGNLATFLWNQSARVIWDQLSLPPTDVLTPYFHSLVRNFTSSPFDSLTGPVKRHDAETVHRNLNALSEHPDLRSLYEAFLDAAWPALEVKTLRDK